MCILALVGMKYFPEAGELDGLGEGDWGGLCVFVYMCVHVCACAQAHVHNRNKYHSLFFPSTTEVRQNNLAQTI